MGELIHGEITGQIIGAAMEVHRSLGPGLIESVYEAAMVRELELRGLGVERQVRYQVTFKDVVVGECVADLVVEGKVVVELKATNESSRAHEKQLIYYLRAAKFPVGLLLNFGMDSLFKKRFVI